LPHSMAWSGINRRCKGRWHPTRPSSLGWEIFPKRAEAVPSEWQLPDGNRRLGHGRGGGGRPPVRGRPMRGERAAEDGSGQARPCCLEWSIGVLPLIPRRNRRQDIPMLDYSSVLEAKQIVERSRPGREISLRQHEYKVALGHETTGGEIQLPSFFGHTCNSIPQPSNSISDFGGVLRIVSVFNKLFDAIEAQ